jgi:predicted amidophosphoribosyltransferase
MRNDVQVKKQRSVGGKTILLFDEVYTTGAMMKE